MSGQIPTSIVRDREQRAWQLSAQGKGQTEIAAALGVSQSAVSQILKRVSLRVQGEMTGAIAQTKAQQCARLDHVYSQAMTAWDESRKPRSLSRRRRRTTAATGQPLEEETINQAESSAGDPQFLLAALAALAGKRKLLGLDAPKKIDRTLNDQRRPLEALSDEELRRMVAETQQLCDVEDEARARVTGVVVGPHSKPH
jgi:transcriptional regulator with XRE-family HTH domain